MNDTRPYPGHSWPDADGVDGLAELITGIHRHRDLTDTVQAVVDAVVGVAGFGVAAISVVSQDDELSTIAVSGDEGAQVALLGVHRPLSSYEDEFAVADQWGSLRYVPHERAPESADELGWVPPTPVPAPDVDGWHPMDALYAPLHSSAGRFLGVLSVDLPSHGRKPTKGQRQLLEMLAGQAGIAIDNVQLGARLRASEEIFRQAFARTGAGMALVAIDHARPGRFLRVNPAFQRILGRTAEELQTMTVAGVLYIEDRATADASLQELLTGQVDLCRLETRLLDALGEPVWVSSSTSVVRSDDGVALCLVMQVEDISHRRARHQQLSHQALHDPLTDLPNRLQALQRLGDAVERSARTGHTGALFFLDVDQFKEVNDRHGHMVGDQLLIMVGQRIRSAVRHQDLVARLGGDEFLIVADDLEGGEISELANRVRTAVSAPITFKDSVIEVAVSVGSAVIRDVDPGVLLREADTAMYRQKHRHLDPVGTA